MTKNKKKDETVLEIRFPEESTRYTAAAVILIVALLISGFIYFKPFNNLSNSENGDELGVQTDTIGPVKGDFGSFTEYDNEICTEDGKPLVIMFSTTWCPTPSSSPTRARLIWSRATTKRQSG